MTTTEILTRAALVAVALLALACNPLDPSKIEQDSGAAASGCAPACSTGQYCLQTQSGACGCFSACDDSQCQAGSCALDPSQGAVCVDLAQTRCP